VRAIRGAITIPADTVEDIRDATVELLDEIARRNRLCLDEVVSVFFTLTQDLRADFPARAARSHGWDVPMLDMQEIPVPGALPRCLRVLVHVERDGRVCHVYLREARDLRPDLENDR
jgi:chorismate mutase